MNLEEEAVPTGQKDDKYHQELLASMQRARDYLEDRVSEDDLQELLHFAQEVYRDDHEIYNGLEWGFLVGIGLMLEGRLE